MQGWRVPPRSRRLIPSPLVRYGLYAAMVGVPLAAWLGVRAVLAYGHLTDARSSLTTARAALLERRIPEASAALASAGRDAKQARSLTDDPLWRAVAAVPYAGRSLRVVSGVTVAVDEVVRQVLPPALSAADIVGPGRLRRPDGAFDIAAIRRATAPARESEARMRRVQRQVADLPTGWAVAAPVARGRTELAGQISELGTLLTDVSRALRVAPALLGEERPRRYFIMAQQTSEARGTGGLVGGFAILEAHQGRLRVPQSGSDAEFRDGPIPPPAGVPADYVAEYGGFGAFSLWRNVNLSPDLPVVARVVAARWRAQGGAPVDGVIAVDGAALASILRGADPIPIAGGREVAPADLERYLAVGQYAGYTLDNQDRRKDELSRFARIAADRLTEAGADDAMLRGVAEAVQRGHLRLASDDRALQPDSGRIGRRRGAAQAGWSGGLPGHRERGGQQARLLPGPQGDLHG